MIDGILNGGILKPSIQLNMNFYRVLSIATKEVHLMGVSLISSERIWPGFSAQLAREAGRPNVDVDFRVLAFQC